MSNKSHVEIIAELQDKVRNGDLDENAQALLATTQDAYYLGMSFIPSTQILRMFFTPRDNPGKLYSVTVVGFKEQFCMLKTHLDTIYSEIQLSARRKVLN